MCLDVASCTVLNVAPGFISKKFYHDVKKKKKEGTRTCQPRQGANAEEVIYYFCLIPNLFTFVHFLTNHPPSNIQYLVITDETAVRRKLDHFLTRFLKIFLQLLSSSD